MNYERQGGGEPLVLVHGIGGELCVWEPLLAALARRRDVIAVDLPGFGRSAPLAPEVVPTPQALADAVAGLLSQLGIDRAHVVGNSLGGWVGLELARAGRACSVVGLCPAGLWGRPIIPVGAATPGTVHRIVRRLRPLLPLLLLSRQARRLALRAFVGDPDRVPYRAAWRMVRSYGGAAAYDATSAAMRQTYFHAPEEIHVPVLLAFGERDRLIRPSRVSAPGYRSIVLPDCGHIPMWDDPQLITDVILQGTGTAAPANGRARSR